MNINRKYYIHQLHRRHRFRLLCPTCLSEQKVNIPVVVNKKLLRSHLYAPLNVFHINENCNNPHGLLLYNFVGDVFIFHIVDNVACIHFTTRIVPISTDIRSVNKVYLLCGRDLYLANIVALLRRLKLFGNVVLLKNGVEKMKVIVSCGRKAMAELFGPRFFLHALLLRSALNRDINYKMDND